MDDFNTVKRLNYFDHQFLRQDDFTAEQEYHLAQRRLHNRYLHTWGIATGLEVEFQAGATAVTVGPGAAIDGRGREIVLATEQSVELSGQDAGALYLTIAYDEAQTDETKVTGAAGNTRWTEKPRIAAYKGNPDDPSLRLVLAIVDRPAANKEVVSVDLTPRRPAGAAAGSLNLLELGFRSDKIASDKWVRMRLDAASTALLEGDLHITGSLAADGGGTFGGPLSAPMADVQKELTVGLVTVGDSVTIKGDVSAATAKLGKLTVDAVAAKTLATTGAVTMGDINVGKGNTLAVAGTTSLINLLVQGTASLSSSLSLAGPATFNQGLTLTGLATLKSGLAVTGATASLGAGLTVAGAATLQNGLSVAGGAGSFGAGLTVTGAATFGGGAFNVSGAAAFSNGLTVSGAGVFNHSLAVAGAASFAAALTVNAAASFTKGLTVTGGPIVPALGNSGQAGIQFPVNPGGGGGDEAFIRYFVESGETTRFVIGTGNDTDDRLSFWQAGAERLTIFNGMVGIGTQSPLRHLHVEGNEITSTGTSAGFSFANRDAPNNGAWGEGLGNRWVWYAQGGTARLWALGDRFTVSPTGVLYSQSAYNCGGDINMNNGNSLYGKGRLHIHTDEILYLLAKGNTIVGKSWGGLGNLTVEGYLYANGGKNAYVIDQFVNNLGDPLEQGDVVIVGENGTVAYYGTDNVIPVPELDLTEQAYDTRVCGIVEAVHGELAEPPPPLPASGEEPAPRKRGRRKKAVALQPRIYDSDERAAQDVTTVDPGQVGAFVTLGAYAFCKVDADIAPIVPGDLLTSSPTKGHAQKVLDRELAMGATIGKALGGLAKGKGKIPIFVTLH